MNTGFEDRSPPSLSQKRLILNPIFSTITIIYDFLKVNGGQHSFDLALWKMGLMRFSFMNNELFMLAERKMPETMILVKWVRPHLEQPDKSS